MPTGARSKPRAELRSASVRSFARGLQVIKTLAQQRTPLTITEVGDHASMTRAGARRLLLTLQELGYVKLDGRQFSLTPRIMELGGCYSAIDPMWTVAERFLCELVEEFNETASAGMLDDLDVVYVLRQRTQRLLHLDIRPGSRLPAHISSIGRVLLAHSHQRQLDRYFQRAVIKRYTSMTITEPKKLRATINAVRETGYALVAGELDEGICGVAVPVREPSGRVVAGIGVSLPRRRAADPDIKNRIVPRMQDMADAICRQITSYAVVPARAHAPHWQVQSGA
jgi:IclR family pca regulon transcriptional regulator